MRTRTNPRSGKVNPGCLFAGLLLVVFVYFAFKWVPVKVAIAELRDTATDEATFAANKKDDEIKYVISKKIDELPALCPDANDTPKDHCGKLKNLVKVERGKDQVRIRIEIEVPVELIGGKVWLIRDEIDVARAQFG